MSGSEESEEATSTRETESEEEKATAFRADCPPPSLLSICHESRAIASKYYRKTFATPHAPARAYFDFDRDTIYVRYDKFSPSCYHYDQFLHEIAKVRKRV
jgi:hypothetical protein